MSTLPQQPAPAPPSLTESQLQLHAAFLRRCDRLAGWYLGAIHTLGQCSNPDRVSQAAHSFRELIDNFPECAGQQVVDVAGGAANVLRGIKDDFQQIERSSAAAANGWAGAIDPPLRTAVLRIRERITAYYVEAPSRTKQAQSAFYALVPGAKTMPVVYQKQNFQAWMDLRRFFNNVAHHVDRSVTEQDFLARVAEFEQIAQAQLAPTPTDDMNKIDQLVEGLERGD